jgi:hypothetical protein
MYICHTITFLEDGGGGRGIAAPTHNFNTRRGLVVNTMTWPLCLQEGDAVLIVQEAGLGLELGWMVIEKLALTNILTLDHPAHGKLLY